MSKINVLAEITDEDSEAYGETVEVEIDLGDIEIAELCSFLEICDYTVYENNFEPELDSVDSDMLEEIVSLFYAANWAGRKEIWENVVQNKIKQQQ